MSIDWGDDLYPELPTMREVLDPDDTGLNICDGRDWWQIFGCTDPTAYNYNPDATNDDGSCLGEKGDINLDECVNVVDVVLLVDMILQETDYDGSIYEHWAADVFVDEVIDISDQIAMVTMILNNPSCTGTQRLFTNSYVNISDAHGLSRSDGDQIEINMVNQEDVRATHFEFVFQDAEILDVELDMNYNFMTLNWTTRGDTLAILVFGAEGQSIPAGSHTLGMITINSSLERTNNIAALDYFWGEYTDSEYGLFSFEYSEDLNNISVIPNEFKLYTPYPNPFNSTVTIQYDLPEISQIDITIFDLQGRVVYKIVNGYQIAGTYQTNWSADGLSSGIYIINLTTNTHQFTQKLMLLK